MIDAIIVGEMTVAYSDGSHEQVELEVVYVTSDFDKAKREAFDVLTSEADDQLYDRQLRKNDNRATMTEIELISVTDKKTGESHYGQLQYGESRR